MEEDFKKLIEMALYLGGGFGLAKWVVSDWRAKSQQIDDFKERSVRNHVDTIKSNVDQVEQVAGSLKFEIRDLKDRLAKLEAKFEMGIKAVGQKNEKSEDLMSAFQGFVQNWNTRFQEIEKSQTEVKEIAKDVFRVSSRPASKK